MNAEQLTPVHGATAGASVGIRLDGLRKVYGPTVAVDRVDLDIAPGEIVALLGPNGAGKSTTIDMMLGLTKPDAGTATLFGGPPREACAAGRVGAMLQNGGLLNDTTVRELVALMRSLYPKALSTRDVVERARIGELLDRRVTKLSGGETQRVRFALAIVPDPDLLVLDEPTAAMDVASRHSFWASMRAWAAGGRTVLFATHYLEEADDFADRIVLLRAGRIVADGSTTEVKSLVAGRTIEATLPGVPLAELEALPGVQHGDRHGDTVLLHCQDSDAALRALLAAYPQVRDIEISGAGLEQAFLRLTGDDSDETDQTDQTEEARR